MEVRSALPENYKERYTFPEKKSFIQTIAEMVFYVVVIGGLLLLVWFIDPLKAAFDVYFEGSNKDVIVNMILMLAGVFLYRFCKSVIRMILLKVLGAQSVKFSFAGTYACSGSDDYFDIMAYIILAVAPIVALGAVLIVINILVPTAYFLPAFMLLYVNFTLIFSEILVLFQVFMVSGGNALVSASGKTLIVYA